MARWNQMESPMYKDETMESFIQATTDYYTNPWTVSSNKMTERAGTILQANYYPPKSTIAPEVDLDSWQKLAPHQWSSDDVINLIYDLAENCKEISPTDLRGERFQNLLGSDLWRMTEEEFTDREPNYGKTLFRCIRQLIQTREHQSSDERIIIKEEDFTCDTVSYAHQGEQPKPVQGLIEDDCAMETCEKLDPALLSILGLHDYESECLTGLDALHMKQGLEFGSEPSRKEQLTKDLSRQNAVNTNSFPYSPAYCDVGGVSFDPCSELPNTTCCYSNDQTSTSFTSIMGAGTWPQTPMMQGAVYPLMSLHTSKKGSSRPMMSREEAWTPSYADVSSAMSATPKRKVHLRKRTHCNRGTHLWEFICRLLKTNEALNVQDRIIQWENQSDGVFRIINSKEVAKLWGKCKRNELMNYEKLSRALRWCRAYGFLSELPKDGNLPKKLCFRFGPRAVNWRNCV